MPVPAELAPVPRPKGRRWATYTPSVSLRSLLKRSPTAVRIYRRANGLREKGRARLIGDPDFESLPPRQAVPLAYQLVLGRQPDAMGEADYTRRLETGELTNRQMVQWMWGSEEFVNSARFCGRTLGPSIHMGRCEFIRSLPRAARIVDLGGTHLHDEKGAMVGLGYPYPFEELVIVDLPSGDRHPLYQGTEVTREVRTELGPVRYRYHSMTDLSGFEDASVDLVYSGQSIEHINPDEGRLMVKDVCRILRPGGTFALDTPNGRVTRLQQAEFIDPDHKVEYRLEELTELLESGGLQVLETKGLNLATQSLAAGRFDIDQVAAHAGLFAEAADCYILCVLSRKPA